MRSNQMQIWVLSSTAIAPDFDRRVWAVFVLDYRTGPGNPFQSIDNWRSSGGFWLAFGYGMPVSVPTV